MASAKVNKPSEGIRFVLVATQRNIEFELSLSKMGRKYLSLELAALG